MAGDILLDFIANSGDVDAILQKVTLSGTQDRALDGATSPTLSDGFGYVWLSISITSPDGHEEIRIAGQTNINTKYMGGNTNKTLIHGYVIAQNSSESSLALGLLALLARNQFTGLWKITVDGREITNNVGAKWGLISSGDMGDGTGPRWPFTLDFTNKAGRVL